MRRPETILRLRQKHAPRPGPDVEVDALGLIDDQSLRAGLRGALLAFAVLTVIWVYAVMLFDQFFPWFSVLEGFFIGRAVQHFGRGIDWRFPVIAAGFAVIAAFTGSFLSALFLTGREFDTAAFSLVTEISWHTLQTFAIREFGVVGTIYAVMAAAIAAFFAKRKLGRNEAIALRKYRSGEL